MACPIPKKMDRGFITTLQDMIITIGDETRLFLTSGSNKKKHQSERGVQHCVSRPLLQEAQPVEQRGFRRNPLHCLGTVACPLPEMKSGEE